MNQKIKRLDNGVFVMVDDTHLSRWVEEDGRLDHEHVYLEKFRHLIPVGGTVVDCGTSIGDHTITYASWVGPTGKVLGFEANSDAAECAALNLGIYDWAKIYNIGLSDDYGVCGIYVAPNVGASKLIPEGREVHLAPLDSYIDEFQRLDFIKIDVEGYEPKLLKGAEAVIMRFRPAMLIEINLECLSSQGFRSDHIYEILSSHGYSWKITEPDASPQQHDILALPPK